MRNVRRSLPFATALLFAGCAAGDFSGDGNVDGPVSIDLLVVPPLGSNVPAQIISGLGAAEVGDGSHDLHLDAGSEVTVHVRSTDLVPIDGAAVRFRMRGAVGYDVVETTGMSGDVTLPLGAAIYDVEVDPNTTLYPSLPPRVFSGITIPTGRAPQEMTLVLEPGLRIRGTVRDSSGSTLQQWQISARMQGNETSRSTAATTSMIGAFEIFVPDAGTWMLQMSPPSLAQGKPVATHTLAVLADIEGYTFDFPPLDTHVITGTVTGIGGLTTDFGSIIVRARAPQLLVDQPVPGAVISFNGSTLTDPGGFFSIPVLNGSYTLSIEPQASFEYSHTVIPNLSVTSDVAVDSFTTLYPKVTVSGSAIDLLNATGTEGARVRLSSSDGATSYQFIDPDGTTADGSFSVLANVGNYKADVLPTPTSGLVRTSQPVTVATAIADLSLGLSSGQVVRGRIYDPDGEAMELVTVLALDPATSLPVGSDEDVSHANGDWALTVPFLELP